MPYSLKGRNVLVTGGELVCLKFAVEGCNVAINYNSSADRAEGVVKKVEQDYGMKAFAIQGDMGLQADCVRVVKEAVSKLGGLDVIISNAGYTRFANFADLNDSTVEDWDLCYAVNVKAHMFLMREALATFNKNADGGVFVITSSIAGRIPSGSSMPYSVTKAAQLHLMRCLASTQGPKIRVNAVLPGFLRTEWGEKYGSDRIKDMQERAYLKKDTDLDDTAQAFIDIAKNTSMTGQRIQIDSGLGQND
ncbi:short-chain dehydrogenase/reductase-like protein sdr [Hyaloscypha hepaticicola]|uniref:Short-chain dehydrogenase/reductase-like protein sdr n=1 Tax=Hyaloscypha hepaticicola TaxID=2082293 RepID=A0A2J6QG09_9HELO|nr:short-chain dehydrogenase/reductase-like protein sdr [Hyaloscypha hepaticicola]